MNKYIVTFLDLNALIEMRVLVENHNEKLAMDFAQKTFDDFKYPVEVRSAQLTNDNMFMTIDI